MSTDLGEILQQGWAASSYDNAARHIKTEITQWKSSGKKEAAGKKWIWELVQNALDTAVLNRKQSLHVVIRLSEDKLIFEHDGGPFKVSELVALLAAGSTKPFEPDKDIIGRFAKGFLVTHTVSTRVVVQGWLTDGQKNLGSFGFLLDRNGSDKDIAENICDCLRNPRQIEPHSASDYVTRYEYFLGDESHSIIQVGLESLKAHAPYVLAFVDLPLVIDIVQGVDRVAVAVEDRKTFYEDDSVIVEKVTQTESHVGGDSIRKRLFVFRRKRSGVELAIPASNSEWAAVDYVGKNVSRIFKILPLVETYDLELPVVINADFPVDDDRFDLSCLPQEEEARNRAINDAFGLVEYAFNWVVENSVKNPELLLWVGPRDEKRRDAAFWKEHLQRMVNALLHANVVRIDSNGLIYKKVSEVAFPSAEVAKDCLDEESFVLRLWQLLRMLGKTVTAKELVWTWHRIRQGWISLGVDLNRGVDLNQLVDVVAIVKSVDDLPRMHPSLEDRNGALTFLRELWLAILQYIERKGLLPDFIQQKAFFPDQNYQLHKHSEVKKDLGVPDDLKSLGQKVGVFLKQKLLASEVSADDSLGNFFQKVGIDDYDCAKAVQEIYSHIIASWKEKKGDTQYLAGVVEFERWLIQREDFAALLGPDNRLSSLPFLCEDGELKVLEDDRFIFPKVFLEDEFLQYEELFRRVILSDQYIQGVLERDIFRKNLESAGFATRTALYESRVRLTTGEIARLGSKKDRNLTGTHAIDAIVQKVSGFQRALNAVAGSGDVQQAKLFVRFILDYLVDVDDSWKREAQFNCSTTGHKEEFTINPSHWLVMMLRTQWVIPKDQQIDSDGSKTLERPSRHNLEGYVDWSLVQNEKVKDFLIRHFGFDNLTLAIKGFTLDDTTKEQALGDLISILPDEIYLQRVRRLIEEHRNVRNLVRRNQSLGRAVEKIVGRAFELRGITVKKAFKGYDFDAYVVGDAIQESDVGQATIDSPKGSFMIEVKATTVDEVKMTLAQASKAQTNGQAYLLCVADLRERGEILERIPANPTDEEMTILAAELESIMCIVKIGEEVATKVSLLQQIVSASGEVRVDLGAAVRFVVPSAIWKDKAISISDWVSRLG